MDNSNELNAIFERIVAGSHTKADVDALRHVLREDQSNWVQIGKYNIKISRGKEIHIGDRIYQGSDPEAIRKIIHQELLPRLTSDQIYSACRLVTPRLANDLIEAWS